MRPILFTTIIVMMLYYSTINDYYLNFGYLKLMYDVGPEEFAMVNIAATAGSIFCIFVVIPTMRHVLKWHESIVLMVANTIAGSAFAATAFSTSLTGFAIPYFFTTARTINYGAGRALQTKGIHRLIKLYRHSY